MILFGQIHPLFSGKLPGESVESMNFEYGRESKLQEKCLIFGSITSSHVAARDFKLPLLPNMTLFPTIGDGQQPKSRGLYTHKDPLYPTKRSLDTGSYEILSLI